MYSVPYSHDYHSNWLALGIHGPEEFSDKGMFDIGIFDMILLIINCQENARLQNWAHLSKLGPFPRIGECS